MVFIKKEKFGRLIRLTDERWQHIIERHPEVEGYLAKIQSTIRYPDIIVKNQYNKNERYYHKYFKSLKNHFIIIVEYEKNFIITAFISRKIKKGEILWKKP
jgi:hypothetical protein